MLMMEVVRLKINQIFFGECFFRKLLLSEPCLLDERNSLSSFLEKRFMGKNKISGIVSLDLRNMKEYVDDDETPQIGN